MRLKSKSFSVIAAAALAVSGAALRTSAQSRAPKKNAPRADEQSAPKKNTARPEDGDSSSASSTSGAQVSSKTDPNAARYVYEFSQPDFYVYFIHVEHDDGGHGTIRFERRSDTEQITDPIEISPAALERIRARWAALNFLDSTENYQGPRTYPSQGKTKLTLRRGGRERTAEFNYSQNADAQGLADEYRRVADQAVLVFDVNVALEAQPLDTPRLIERIESLIDTNSLSDKQQIIPLLRSLSEDERVPLVGRNHALRILKKLDKEKPGK
ncbi:MAG TPA: hypothetical protein VFA21_14350 [Pyrinomonadaceae bacterium]|nr:hypothetical protein [Pyrinomonadaceae bacterium]